MPDNQRNTKRHTISINQQLGDIAENHKLAEYFEEQRRNIGKAYKLANEIREASKDGIYFLKKGNNEAMEKAVEAAKSSWTELLRLNLPKDIAWQHQAEAGQEMVELIIVKLFYTPALYPGMVDKLPSLPSYEELMVTPQAWLAGIADATTELYKLSREILLKMALKEERIEVRKQYLKIARQFYDFLEKLETVYARVINNSRRKGYGNTFRGAIGRIENVIAKAEEELIEIMEREA